MPGHRDPVRKPLLVGYLTEGCIRPRTVLSPRGGEELRHHAAGRRQQRRRREQRQRYRRQYFPHDEIPFPMVHYRYGHIYTINSNHFTLKSQH